MRQKPDIATQNDLEKIVSAFYDQVMTDTLLGEIFTEVANVDLATHKLRVVAFWTQSLFKRGNYSGQVFSIHKALHKRSPLKIEHFDRWVDLFQRSVDTYYAGPRSEKAKLNAQGIASAMCNALNRKGT